MPHMNVAALVTPIQGSRQDKCWLASPMSPATRAQVLATRQQPAPMESGGRHCKMAVAKVQ